MHVHTHTHTIFSLSIHLLVGRFKYCKLHCHKHRYPNIFTVYCLPILQIYTQKLSDAIYASDFDIYKQNHWYKPLKITLSGLERDGSDVKGTGGSSRVSEFSF